MVIAGASGSAVGRTKLVDSIRGERDGKNERENLLPVIVCVCSCYTFGQSRLICFCTDKLTYSGTYEVESVQCRVSVHIVCRKTGAIHTV